MTGTTPHQTLTNKNMASCRRMYALQMCALHCSVLHLLSVASFFASYARSASCHGALLHMYNCLWSTPLFEIVIQPNASVTILAPNHYSNYIHDQCNLGQFRAYSLGSLLASQILKLTWNSCGSVGWGTWLSLGRLWALSGRAKKKILKGQRLI